MSRNVDKIRKAYRVCQQLTLVALYPVIFHMAALLGEANSFKDMAFRDARLPLVCIIIFGVLLAVTIVLAILSRGAARRTDNVKHISWAGLLIVGVIALLMRLPMVGTFQRWDAGEYFFTVGTSVTDYKYTLAEFFFQFCIAYHPNYGFSSFIAIPLFFGHRNVVLITAWQIAFSVLAVMAIFVVLQKKVGLDGLKAAVGAVMFGCVPIFLGLSVYCTPDYYMVLFFIFALYFAAMEKRVLETFCLVMMCFSKETAALIVFGYYGVRILYRFIFPVNKEASSKRAGLLDRIKSMIACSDFWVALFVGVMFVAGMILQGAGWADKTEEGAAATSFGINPFFVIIKMKQYLLTNFAWIISLILAGCVIYSVVTWFKARKSKKKGKNEKAEADNIEADDNTEAPRVINHERRMFIAGLMGAMVFFAAFGMLFHIAALERYDTFFAVSLVLVTYSIVCSLGEQHKKLNRLIIPLGMVLTVLLGVESYITIDPVTRKGFHQVSTGKWTMNYESEFMSYFGDGLVTNYQYAWIDKAFDKVLEDINYDGKQPIYMPARETGVGSGVQFEGNSGYFRVGWFNDKKARDYYDYFMEGWEDLYISPVYGNDTWFPYAKTVTYGDTVDAEYITDKADLVFVPYFEEQGVMEDTYVESIGKHYYVGQRETSGCYLGEMPHYSLIKKDSLIEGMDIGLVAEELENAKTGAEPSEIMGAEELVNEKDRLYNRKLSSNLVIGQMNSEGRKKIGPLDSVYIRAELFDKDGNKIDLLHNDRDLIVKAGVEELLPEVDEAILEMSVGDTRELEVLIPEDYPELIDYAGQTLKAKISIVLIACKYKYDLTDEQKEEYMKEAEQEVNETFETQNKHFAARSLAEEYLNSGGEFSKGSADAEKYYQLVEQYYDNYLKDLGISEEEFCQNYLKTDVETYRSAREILGRYLELREN